MKPRYTVVNLFERDNFEKEWQLPFGYGNNIISFDPQEPIDLLHRLVEQYNKDPNDFIVEKITKEGRELYYRI